MQHEHYLVTDRVTMSLGYQFKFASLLLRLRSQKLSL